MPRAEFGPGDKLPHPEQLAADLWKEAADESPVVALRRLVTNLADFERQYGMRSEDFYAKFQTGQMGDEHEIMVWAAKYEMYTRLKDKIEQGLERVGA